MGQEGRLCVCLTIMGTLSPRLICHHHHCVSHLGIAEAQCDAIPDVQVSFLELG